MQIQIKTCEVKVGGKEQTRWETESQAKLKTKYQMKIINFLLKGK